MSRHSIEAILFSLVLANVAVVFAGRARAGDWPRYRGPNHDGIATEGIDRWPPQEIWRASVGQGYSQVTVSQGRVYTMGWANDQDTVFCFNEGSTGTNPSPAWDESYACSSDGNGGYAGTRATPTVDGNEVYTFSLQGEVRCFNKVGGTPLWTKSTGFSRPGYGFASSVLVDNTNNVVIVNSGAAGTAIRKSDPHDVVWGTNGSASHASPMPFTWNSQPTVAIFTHTRVVGVNPANGAERWQFPWDFGAATHPGDPIVSGDRIWVSCGYNEGCRALQLGTGTLTAAWSNTEMRNKLNCTVLWNGYVYGVDEGGQLRCVEFASGTRKWEQNGFGTEASVMIAGGELVAFSNSGDLVVADLDPNSYVERHRQNDIIGGTTWTCPVVANGKLYLRSHQGTLVCFDVTASSPPELDRITVSPSSAAIQQNASQQFTAQSFDQYNDPFATTISWSVSGGGGMSPGTGSSSTFTSNGALGTFTVTASSGAVSGTATVAVQEAPQLSSIDVSPASWTMYAGTSKDFTATTRDQFGNPFSATVSWSVSGSGSVSPSTGQTTTYTAGGSGGVVTLTASAGGFQDSATVTVQGITDSDGDGMDDDWEILYFGDLSHDQTTDADGDGTTDYEEFLAGTDPTGGGMLSSTGFCGGPLGAAPWALMLLAALSLAGRGPRRA